jgi:ABC-2 type transport system ATP-binding protein
VASNNDDTRRAAIKVESLHKDFILPHERHTGIKQYLVNVLKQKKGYEHQRVLKGISFEVKEGDFFGIVGRNGSGKSTLLKLLAGIYTPGKGSVNVEGTLVPFIELGVGFNPELTGRENVFLNGALLGFSRKEMEAKYDSIVKFSELERFMDQKLKNYSSGMQVRLAFSIAIRAQGDILLLDEVLAVGDAAFQRKCFDYFMDLKKKKRTVILVTHDMGAVRQYCNRAIMIDAGEILAEGTAEEVAQEYQKFFSEKIDSDEAKRFKEKGQSKRWGTGKIQAEKTEVTVGKDTITIKCSFKAKESVPAPIFGFTVYGPAGNNIIEGNTEREKFTTKKMDAGQSVTLDWEIPNIFVDGKYTVAVASCDESKIEFYDWLNEARSFNISKDKVTGGLVNPPVAITNYRLSEGK